MAPRRVAQDDLPRIADLDNPSYFPYRYGQSLWAYFAHAFGDDIVWKAMIAKAKGGAVGRLTAVTGKSAFSLTEGWHAFIREQAHVESGDNDDKDDAKKDNVKDPAVKKPSKRDRHGCKRRPPERRPVAQPGRQVARVLL